MAIKITFVELILFTLIILLFGSSPSSRFASHMMMTVGKTMRSGETWSRSLVTAVSLLTNGLTVSTFTISSSLIVSSPPEGRRRRGDVRSRDEGGPTEGKDERRGWRWCNPFRSLLLAYASLVAHYRLHHLLASLRYARPLRGEDIERE